MRFDRFPPPTRLRRATSPIWAMPKQGRLSFLIPHVYLVLFPGFFTAPFCIPSSKGGKIAPKGGIDMTIGTVLGPVELLRAVPGAEGKRFVQLRCGGQLLTALDPVGVQPGERVLLTAGESAAKLCQELSVDAVILGVAGNKG